MRSLLVLLGGQPDRYQCTSCLRRLIHKSLDSSSVYLHDLVNTLYALHLCTSISEIEKMNTLKLKSQICPCARSIQWTLKKKYYHKISGNIMCGLWLGAYVIWLCVDFTVITSYHFSLCEFKTVQFRISYSMVQSPSWEANWFAASQEIPRISRNPKVHYRTHKRPTPIPILGQPNPVHIPTSHLLDIRPNIIHPSTPRSPQWSLFLRFSHQDPIHLPLHTHTCHMPSPSTLESIK